MFLKCVILSLMKIQIFVKNLHRNLLKKILNNKEYFIL